MNDIFNPYKISVSKTTQLVIFDIENITPKLNETMDTCLVSICQGIMSKDEITYVKKDLCNFLQKKATSKQKKRHYPLIMGATAEFFCHLYLMLEDYNLEFIYRNLEEDSAKKGFDGYYLDSHNNTWIMESKSGYFLTATHQEKIKEAFNDLNRKFLGKCENNPWRNAYNHASHTDVNAPTEIRDVLKNLANDFTDKKFPNINDFNIIPCGTIFRDGTWENTDFSSISNSIKQIEKDIPGKEKIVICITNNSIKTFCNYLGVQVI
ncbi:hypothetical protein [Treponema sp.]|uniref:hypothetical protein n=1 Tax=Treponema sp. TaxID=166 RepID=UPI003FD7FF19